MRTVYARGGKDAASALVEDGRLCEYLTGDAGGAAADTVFLGRIKRVAPGIGAAFVDIGQERMGFLPIHEKSGTFSETPLHDGDRVAVQVRREAHGGKGAFLSRDITLCGTFVILMPLNRYIGVSARITRKDTADRLRRLGREIARERFGLVFRTAAEAAAEADIAAEAEALLAVWRDIADRAPTAHAPSVIHRPDTPLAALLRDYKSRGIDRVVTDNPAIAEEAVSLGIPNEMTAGDPFAGQPWMKDVKAALERRIVMGGGESIVIDPCEALTAIDVNSGGNTGSHSAEATIVKVNLAVIPEIVCQLRLRNIQGIIIIDFIDMEEEASRETVLAALRAELEKDRRKTAVHGFTSLGLVEMTRKRAGLSLREMLASQEGT